MSMKVAVRIVRTWDVEVDADYGETPEDLCAKAKMTGDPAETRVLLTQDGDYPEPDAAPEYAGTGEWNPAEMRKSQLRDATPEEKDAYEAWQKETNA